MLIAVSSDTVSRLPPILTKIAGTNSLCNHLSTTFSKHSANEFVPLGHTGSLFRHIVPTIVVLRTHILQCVILDAIADFLRTTRLSCQRLPSSAKVAVRNDRNYVAIPLPPPETIAGHMADRSLCFPR